MKRLPRSEVHKLTVPLEAGRRPDRRKAELEPSISRLQCKTRVGRQSARVFLRRTGLGLGNVALASLLGDTAAVPAAGVAGVPHFPAKAKRVIYLFQSGAPSQLDLFDDKPKLKDKQGTELPEVDPQGPAASRP